METRCTCVHLCFSRLADQMRLMTFPQWFDLLKNVFESFLFFLQRIKVSQNSSWYRAPIFSLLDFRRWFTHPKHYPTFDAGKNILSVWIQQTESNCAPYYPTACLLGHYECDQECGSRGSGLKPENPSPGGLLFRTIRPRGFSGPVTPAGRGWAGLPHPWRPVHQWCFEWCPAETAGAETTASSAGSPGSELCSRIQEPAGLGGDCQ